MIIEFGDEIKFRISVEGRLEIEWINSEKSRDAIIWLNRSQVDQLINELLVIIVSVKE